MGIRNAKLRILDKVDNTSDKDKNVKYSSVSNTITEQKVLNTNIQKYLNKNISGEEFLTRLIILQNLLHVQIQQSFSYHQRILV